jgi:hypothetical protein
MSCPNEVELTALPDNGIGLVVSLLESTKPGYQLPSGLRLIRLPVDDNDAPAEAHFEFVVRLCAMMYEFRRQQDVANGVAVHCEHGRGRTGLLMAAYRAYVAAQHPSDPEGRTPAETITEVHRKLHEIYGTSAYSLAERQIQWVALFSRKVRHGAATEWSESAKTELKWQRVGGASEVMPGRTLWQCPDCGGLALLERSSVERPTWCLVCGWPTE